MIGKVFVIIVLIVAILVGILGVALPSNRLADYILIVKFFDGMLPILGVGALIKYLCSNHPFK
ncbi:MAG: hypothetical protein CMF50_08585 [Legionellales bacterium]|nr:hypothetical protein [Legionellales bacterium]|tara:strand:- start:40314 stop:40502 length:189 start_codon:yes stop_codon:yes gene_type:complete